MQLNLKANAHSLTLALTLVAYALATIPFLGSLLLSYDEAHYALYGYYLAWSYFDHPPLVGWIQAAMQLLGDSELLLRLPAFICSVVTLTGIWFFIRQYILTSSDIKAELNSIHTQVFLIALMLFLSAPIFLLLSFALIPDSLLIALTLPIIMQTKRASLSSHWQDYALLGLLLGLAALTKYTAVLLAFSAAAYILWVRGVKALVDPRCYLATLLVLLIFSPVIIWNIQSSGSSFAYQLDHGFGREWLNFTNILLSQLFQLVAYGPLVYCLSMLAAIWILRTKITELYILVFFALPIFIVFFISPAFGKFLPHWVAVMFVTLSPAVAVMLYEIIVPSPSSSNQHGLLASIKAFLLKRKLFGGMLLLLLVLSIIITLPLRLLISGLELKFPPYTNPQATLIGWNDTSDMIQQDFMDNTQEEDGIIFVNNWSYASSLAWYARPMKVIVLDNRKDQFDVWFGSPQQGQAGYLVVPSFDPAADARREEFTSCDLWAENTYSIKSSPAVNFSIYKCRDLMTTNF